MWRLAVRQPQLQSFDVDLGRLDLSVQGYCKVRAVGCYCGTISVVSFQTSTMVQKTVGAVRKLSHYSDLPCP